MVGECVVLIILLIVKKIVVGVFIGVFNVVTLWKKVLIWKCK